MKGLDESVFAFGLDVDLDVDVLTDCLAVGGAVGAENLVGKL